MLLEISDDVFKTLGLFIVTAITEIVGCYLPYCYLPYLWIKENQSAWLLVPAIFSLGIFVWLLTLHPEAAARTYAAYGGVYISVAILWLWLMESTRPSFTVKKQDLTSMSLSKV